MAKKWPETVVTLSFISIFHFRSDYINYSKVNQKEHISENYDSLNFKLNDGAMKVLDELNNNLRVVPVNFIPSRQ